MHQSIRFIVCKIFLPFLAIMLIVACKNPEKKEDLSVQKSYGKFDNSTDSISVELQLDRFKNWSELLSRIDSVVCNDSVPKITLKTENEIKTIYFRNPCWENFGCILIKRKNVIEIHNDTIYKNDKNYSLDSLRIVLKRDIENNGEDSNLSNNLESLLIFISYDSLKTKQLHTILDKLTANYEAITNKTDIKIMLKERILGGSLKIPPPPKIPDEIELITKEE